MTLPGSRRLGRLLLRPLALLLLAGLALAAPAQERLHHGLKVTLDPAGHRLSVRDRITLPEVPGGPVSFTLHAGLSPQIETPGATLSPAQAAPGADPSRVATESYTVVLPPHSRRFTLSYGGTIHHPVARRGAEYAGSFGVSPGLIGPQGVFLSGASGWYPQLAGLQLDFDLEIHLPPRWRSVSQGLRTRRTEAGGRVHERWVVGTPQEEIYLVAGTFHEYDRPVTKAQAMVFLREPDPTLAARYLEATDQYLALYDSLIGPYAYPKFALVENFWETGYGMPSFTLLGPRVIRLPFIPHSSYPHEILHNWWGNGVYVDYATGNWSEGLTAYLADHLIKEQQGRGAEYRRTTLQRYTDYVRSAQDFPLTEFRSRHSAVTQAVGYGKTLMLFHMLRGGLPPADPDPAVSPAPAHLLSGAPHAPVVDAGDGASPDRPAPSEHGSCGLGDPIFIAGLRRLYHDRLFQVTDFDQVRGAFSAVSGRPLTGFFDQWVRRTGAPSLRLGEARAEPAGQGYRLVADLEQTQDRASYRLCIPLAVTLEGRDRAYQTHVHMAGRAARIELPLPARPLRLDVDPEFDVFRRLDRTEIPPALSQAFGADSALIVIPEAAPPALRRAYRALAESWQPGRRLRVVDDHTLGALPRTGTVWILGWENRLRPEMDRILEGYDYTDQGADGVRIAGRTLSAGQDSVVVVGRRPRNPDQAIAWIATRNPSAVAGLARKLPHYGRYSYLAFRGDGPDNTLKGQWPVVGSVLSVAVVQPDGSRHRIPRARLAPRHPLAETPAPLSAPRMHRDIATLAAPAMHGRGLGTPELDRAAQTIAQAFRKAGLRPGGDTSQSFFQDWTVRTGAPPREMRLRNVVGILPGTRTGQDKGRVVLSAHYDHLGRGWPDVHQGDEGKIHPGADDNASGVAVMLELARVMGRASAHCAAGADRPGTCRAQPRRDIVFVAFSGEEAGRLGSTHFIEALGDRSRAIVADLNLDTVGRLGQRPVLALGTASASQWPPILRGVAHLTGIALQAVPTEYGASDQKSFVDAGIPAIQLFAGPHPDYHRPGDTVDKIDDRGLVKVATVARELIGYLSSRPAPLTAALRRAGPGPADRVRRATLGTVPDFGYTGHGVRITGTRPGSPAAELGLEAGDVIVGLGTAAIPDLRALAQALKGLSPGDTVTVHWQHLGVDRRAQTRLEVR